MGEAGPVQETAPDDVLQGEDDGKGVDEQLPQPQVQTGAQVSEVAESPPRDWRGKKRFIA